MTYLEGFTGEILKDVFLTNQKRSRYQSVELVILQGFLFLSDNLSERFSVSPSCSPLSYPQKAYCILWNSAGIFITFFFFQNLVRKVY